MKTVALKSEDQHLLNFWELPGKRVFAGEYPGSPDIAAARQKLLELLELGVTTIIDLTEPSEGLREYDALLRTLPGGRFVHHVRSPIQDVSTTDDARMHFILDAIESALDTGGCVYVHCWGGIGRTGMVLGCLMVRQGIAFDDAIARVNAAWRNTTKAQRPTHARKDSPETDAQKDVIRRWADRECTRQAIRAEKRSVAAMIGDVGERDTSERADRRRRTRGCLLGGAVGDALGWPVEFKKLEEIRKYFGPNGITEIPFDMNLGCAPITDDTQMTLFTAEGMLRGISRGHERGMGGPMSCMTQAYLRWLVTQGKQPASTEQVSFNWPLVLGWAAEKGPLATSAPEGLDPRGIQHPGWLVRVKRLHAQRAPGNTCLDGLMHGGTIWNGRYTNDSKGNGGVMRIAPVGLFPGSSPDEVFEVGCAAAGITHCHPTGRLSAGVFARMIFSLMHGAPLRDAAEDALAHVRTQKQHKETSTAMKKALAAHDSGRPSSPELVATLGQGWIAEEALAIAILCALRGEETQDFASALRLAVNHDGDSDSTGSMTGQLLGTRFGVEAIPVQWRGMVELSDVITQVADDIVTEWREGAEWWGRYPGY